MKESKKNPEWEVVNKKMEALIFQKVFQDKTDHC